MGNPKLFKYGQLSIEIDPNDSNLLYFDEIDQWELTLNFGFGAKTSASKRVSYWRGSNGDLETSILGAPHLEDDVKYRKSLR